MEKHIAIQDLDQLWNGIQLLLHAVAKYAGCRLIDSKSNKELQYNKENLLNPFFLVLSN